MIGKGKIEAMEYAQLENPSNNIFETHQIVGFCLVGGFLLMIILEELLHICWNEKFLYVII